MSFSLEAARSIYFEMPRNTSSPEAETISHIGLKIGFSMVFLKWMLHFFCERAAGTNVVLLPCPSDAWSSSSSLLLQAEPRLSLGKHEKRWLNLSGILYTQISLELLFLSSSFAWCFATTKVTLCEVKRKGWSSQTSWPSLQQKPSTRMIQAKHADSIPLPNSLKLPKCGQLPLWSLHHKYAYSTSPKKTYLSSADYHETTISNTVDPAQKDLTKDDKLLSASTGESNTWEKQETENAQAR